jgi:5'-nucleotidase
LLGFVKEKIDLVVAGINPNPNLGQDLTYSGTVTAALESIIANIPGLAFSTEGREPDDYEQAGRIALKIARAVSAHTLPAGVALNVNVPHGALRGICITRQGWSLYHDQLVERLDPRGKPYYWIGGERPSGIANEGTDFWAMENGYVSITPLHLDLTAHQALPTILGWNLEL